LYPTSGKPTDDNKITTNIPPTHQKTPTKLPPKTTNPYQNSRRKNPQFLLHQLW
jgi:hypothetical protein